MARTIGSSLAAKAAPGSVSRGLVEKRNEEQNLLGRGKIGSLERAQIEEPLERAVPAGSAKIAAQQPLIEGGVVSPTFDAVNANPPVLSSGIGLNPGGRTGIRGAGGIVAAQVPPPPPSRSSFLSAIDGSGAESGGGERQPSSQPGGASVNRQAGATAPARTYGSANANAVSQVANPNLNRAPSVNKLGGGAIGTVGGVANLFSALGKLSKKIPLLGGILSGEELAGKLFGTSLFNPRKVE